MINTFLDLNQSSYRDVKYEYDGDIIFSFFGFTQDSPRVKNILLKLNSITHIGFFNEKCYNKSNSFTGFKRYGVIRTAKTEYFTEPEYTTKLKSHYFRGALEETTKKLLKDKTKNGVAKKIYNIEYKVLHEIL